MTSPNRNRKHVQSNEAIIAQTQFNYGLASLNFAFLLHIRQENMASLLQWGAIPAHVVRRVQGLSRAECLLAAQCPVTLFESPWARWTQRHRVSDQRLDGVLGWSGMVSAGAMIWHSVRRLPLLTGFGFGLSAEAIKCWRAMSYSQWVGAAMSHARKIGIRWAHVPGFWIDLVDAVEEASFEKMKGLRRLCVQLQGAEMLDRRD